MELYSVNWIFKFFLGEGSNIPRSWSLGWNLNILHFCVPSDIYLLLSTLRNMILLCIWKKRRIQCNLFFSLYNPPSKKINKLKKTKLNTKQNKNQTLHKPKKKEKNPQNNQFWNGLNFLLLILFLSNYLIMWFFLSFIFYLILIFCRFLFILQVWVTVNKLIWYNWGFFLNVILSAWIQFAEF